jgi:hypothetical protein
VVAALLAGLPRLRAEPAPEAAKPPLWPGFPRQDAKLVREVVAVAHFNEKKVRELVEARPALANAWWDWGFGDWESPLGAAAHVGSRPIALYLIAQGARIDIFAAAMLGLTDVVKAFVAAQPGVQRTRGPHGIPLLAHAKVGGKPAADTLAYLESLGDAGQVAQTVPLADDRKKVYVGRYAVEGAATPLEVKIDKGGRLTIEIQAEPDYRVSRWINHAGQDEFFPAGVPSVRIRFDVQGGKARSLTLIEREPVVTANRVEA